MSPTKALELLSDISTATATENLKTIIATVSFVTNITFRRKSL